MQNQNTKALRDFPLPRTNNNTSSAHRDHAESRYALAAPVGNTLGRGVWLGGVPFVTTARRSALDSGE